jgi:hypothetical protein
VKQKFILRSEEIRRRASDLIREIPLDVVHEVVIRPYKSKRSLDQNALHWKRMDIIRLHIADSTGQVFSAEDVHEFFKKKFLPVRLIEIGGESVKVRRTTTQLNTKEFSEFMDNIDRYCIEHLQLWLPEPGMEEM